MKGLWKTLMDPTPVVFSDDIEWCKKNLNHLSGCGNFSEKNMIFPNDDEVFEMYLMSVCDEVIMANSSFSWWGSYLGKEGRTVAPKEWFMPNSIVNYQDIYRDDWIFCEYSRLVLLSRAVMVWLVHV